MRTAYSYLRFSSAKQRDGDSLRRQTENRDRACREFGWQLSNQTFDDPATSGFRSKNLRKDLGKFLALQLSGKLEDGAVLILEDFDRLSRAKMLASLDLVRQIIEGGIDVFCVLNWRLYTKDSLDEPMSLLEMLWRFYLAHEESKKKSIRSKANWQQKHDKALTEVMSSRRPAWLDFVDGRFVPIPARVKVIEDIFAWCIAGQGVLVINHRLSRDVQPFNKSWSQKTIHQILTDRRVIGDLPTQVYGDKRQPGPTIPGYYPKIISEDTYYAALAALASRKGKSGRPGHFLSLFTGLVHLPAQDSTMVMLSKPKKSANTSSKGQLFSYRYLVSYKGFKGLAPYVGVPYEAFERCVLDWLVELKSETLSQGQDVAQLESLLGRKAFLQSRIDELNEQLHQVNTQVASVVQTVAQLENEMMDVKRQIEDYRKSLTAPSLDTIKPAVERLRSTQGDDHKQAREIVKQQIRLWVERIDVVVDKIVRLTIKFHSGVVRRIWFQANPYQAGLWTDDGHIPGTDIDILGTL